jgi:spore maturation protein CgeB
MTPSILYIGDDTPHTTSVHRAEALRRLGHEVQVVNPEPPVGGRLASSFHHRTGYRFLQRVAERAVLKVATKQRFDLVWVNGGSAVSAALVKELKRRFGLVVNYNNDDPFGPGNTRHWRTLLDAVPQYDLLAVVRESNVSEAYEYGARRVLRVWMSYDEEAHKPRELTPADGQRWHTEVLFVGTWLPERGPFLLDLTRRGVPLSIFGARWPKAKEWRQLRSFWRGGHLIGDDYAKAIQCARVTLGLLSKQNRDLHTQRSLEVPALGGLFCGERTIEHMSLYQEGVEAVFWSDAAECAEKCLSLLADADRRNAIAEAGHRKVLSQAVSNEKVIARVVDAALPMCSDDRGAAGEM